jgi:exodeoxyribonuclease VII small subunit
MATKTPNPKPSEENFESAMARLEAIVMDMESDKLPLEDLLTRYEEGVKLVKVCEEKLSVAEKRIEIITRNAAGEPQIEGFDLVKKNAAPAGGDVSLF